jgi:hypothetical protein
MQIIIQNSTKDISNYSQIVRDLKIAQEYVITLEQTYESLKLEHTKLENEMYTQKRETVTTKSDLMLIQQEIDQRNIECVNLKNAIDLMTKNLENELVLVEKKIAEIKTLEQSFINKDNSFFKKKIINKDSLLHKYFGPFYGIYYLWLNRDKNIIYINYLPLWNFLIFLFLPKKTIIGPITGGVYHGKVYSFNSFIRKYIFPIFYKISVFIIYRKFKGVIFSTDLLKNYIPKTKYRFTLLLIIYGLLCG